MMPYHIISLFEILNKTGVSLKPIEEYESDFGKSYTSPFVKGGNKFYEIITYIFKTKVGEIEYGQVDPDTIEVISIHINKDERSKRYGEQAITALTQETKSKHVIIKAAPSSRPFWKKLGYKPMPNTPNYFEKFY
jgi:hypothetical protein